MHGFEPTDPVLRLLRKRKITSAGCFEWTGFRNNHGYGQIGIGSKTDGTRKLVACHRLAASLWMGFDLNSPSNVLHSCDNPACFNPEHLFIGTHLDNMRDCKAKGRYAAPHGTRNARAKLDAAKVAQIREMSEAGAHAGIIAHEFGVGRTTIRQVLAGNTWGHIA